MTAYFVPNNGRVAGYPGLGFYRLALSLDLSYNLSSPSGAAALEIPAGDLKVRSRGDYNYLLGPLLPAQGPVVLHATREIRVNTIEFITDLSQHQLKAIEDLRLGGELTFVATFYPGLHTSQGYLRQVPMELSLPVNQSGWAQIREQMGAGRTLLYEIRQPSGETAQAMPAAVQHWRNAWHEMLRGGEVGYRQAVAECRPVLAGISRAIGEGNDQTASAELQTILRPLRAVGTQLSKSERLRLLRRVLTLLCGLAHHPDEIALPTVWELSDAELVVGACAALLQLYGRPSP